MCDFGVYVIKPDGLHLGIHDYIQSEISRKGLLIEEEIITKLNKQDVPMLFNTDFDMKLYSDYMSSDAVIVGVCSGSDVQKRLNELKHQIRKKWNREGDMKNLFHTAEEGKELFREMSFFFPYWKENKWMPSADMYINVNMGRLDDYCLYLEEKTNLHYAGFIINEKRENEKFCYNGRIITLFGVQIMIREADGLFPLAVYFKSIELAQCVFRKKDWNYRDIQKYAKDNEGIVAIGRFDMSSFEHKKMGKYMDEKVVYLYDASYSYEESNILEYWTVRRRNMIHLGGSAGVLPGGEFGVEAVQARRMLELMGGE